jgi:predicted GIY-YIG superfamily endonuclease
MGTVYLIHFDAPYKHAKHYIGWTEDLSSRIQSHVAGNGARLISVINAAGNSPVPGPAPGHVSGR